MLNILEHRARLVALEAYTTESVLDLVRGVAGDISANFGDFVARFSAAQPGLRLSGSRQAFVGEMTKHSYSALRPLVCYVPEGLKVSYLDYLQVLLPAAQRAADYTPALLNSFSLYLANLVNNRNAFGTAGPLRVKISNPAGEVTPAGLKDGREELLQRLGKCFKAGSHETASTLGAVVARNNDWSVVLKQADELAQTLNRVDRKALQKKSQECVDLLNIIAKMVERNEFKDASPEVAKALSDGAFEGASEMEFFSSVYFRSLALTEALNATTANLLSILAQK